MKEKLQQIEPIQIENRIFTFRGEQVMIDSDLAEMYQVELKRLNEQVKRNIERFPEAFRFQLTSKEQQNLDSQSYSTNSKSLRSQIATLENGRGKHSKYFSYAFTEQGVAMLSAVLRSEIAIKVSLQIMNAFVQMRKTIGNHQQLLQLSADFTEHKLDSNQKFEAIFKALETPKLEKKQGVFFDGQTYDAYEFTTSLIKKATQSIVLIDNYIDDTVITQLTKKQKDVKVYLLCKTISKHLQLDINKANTQYPIFKGINFNKAHDRFLILDQKEVYHLGASLKDLGKKWFAFSKIENDALTILQSIKGLIENHNL